MTSQRREQLRRFGALALCLLGVPLLLTLGSLVQDSPIRVGEPSPRTVVAPDQIRIDDPEGTEAARTAAAESVQPVLVTDDEATAAIVRSVRSTFDTIAQIPRRGGGRGAGRAAGRASARGGRRGFQLVGHGLGGEDAGALEAPVPAVTRSARAIDDALPFLDEDAAALLAELSDEQLAAVRTDAVQIAQEYARGAHAPDAVEDDVATLLRQELALRSLPQGTGRGVIDPVVREAAQPTLREDANATAAARERAAADVTDITQSWARGAVIVGAGEVVSGVQLAALRSRDLDGADPVGTLVRAFATALLVPSPAASTCASTARGCGARAGCCCCSPCSSQPRQRRWRSSPSCRSRWDPSGTS